MMKLTYTVLIIGIFQIFFSPLALAAKIDFIEETQETNISEFGELDLTTSPMWEVEGIVSPEDLLESKEFEEEIKSKLAKYQDVVNLIKQQQYDQATKKIEALIKLTPDDPHLYNLQGLNFQMQSEFNPGNKQLAKQSFTKVLQLDPDNSLANISLAKLAISDNQLDKAKEYLDKALKHNDKSPTAYLLLAGMAFKQGNHKQTEQILLSGHTKVQGDINAEIQIVSALNKFYLYQKQPEKTLDISQGLVIRYPDNIQALSILANAQIANNQLDTAEKTLQKLIALDKENTKHYLLLAYFLSKQPGRENEALKLMDEVFKINPANPQTLILKATYLLELKRYKQALDTVNKMDQLFPGIKAGYQLKGNIYLAEKKYDQAFEAYQQVYRSNPDFKLLLLMSDLLLAQGKDTQAIDLLKQESVKLNNKPLIDFKLAGIYAQQKDYSQAEKYYKLVLAEKSDNVPSLNNLAWIYAQQNNPEAKSVAEQAYKIAPESAIVSDTYGYILINNGEEAEGLKILQKAEKADPQSSSIQFHLAEAYSVNGNKQKAISILKKLNKKNKSYPEKEKADELLSNLQNN